MVTAEDITVKTFLQDLMIPYSTIENNKWAVEFLDFISDFTEEYRKWFSQECKE